MAYTIACQDAGVDCPYVARGNTEDEVLQDGIKHVKEAHGYTDEQLNPEFLEEVKKIMKKTQLFRPHRGKGPASRRGLFMRAQDFQNLVY